MKTNTNCCSATASPCDTSIAELPRYYPRQLITPDDLTLEQNYFRDRLRRHNRLLHGWGVVCGALVCPVPNPNAKGSSDRFLPWQVQVQQGYILGPYGDEIIVDCVRTVDIRTSGTTGITGEPCLDAPDPWCSQIYVTRDSTTTLFVAVKYRQCMTRPVRVMPAGCGCNDTSCEYSRWQDGYEIGVLTECPSCNDGPPTVGMNTDGVKLDLIPQGDVPGCPDCSCGPWVGLAEIAFDANGTITKINNSSCRRMVMSFSQFWWSNQGPKPTIKQLVSPTITAGTSGVAMTLTGTNFRCGATAKFDNPNFSVASAYVKDPQTMALMVNVSSDAKSADASPNIAVMNLDGIGSDSFATNIKVTDAPAASASGTRAVLTTAKTTKKTQKVSTPTKPE